MERVLTLVLLCALSALGQTDIPNVGNVVVIKRTEIELTFRWDIVDGNRNYSYILTRDGVQGDPITVTEDDDVVIHKVPSLSPGTQYSFILYTVFEENQSSGFPFSSVTVPSNVGSVLVIDRKETEITLEWNKVSTVNAYTYELEFNDEYEPVPTPGGSSVVYRVKPLPSGTEIFFTLYTVFEGEKSSGFNFSNITVPSNVGSVLVIDRNETEMTLQWERVNNRNEYTYELVYGDKIETISTQPNSSVEYKVESLSSGTEYSFTLSTVFKDLKSSGYKFANVTVPSNVEKVDLAEQNDTDVILKWDKKTYSYTLECSKDPCENINITAEGNTIMCHISGLIPATNYIFTVYTEFFDVRSTGFNYKHTTTLSSVTEVRVDRSLTQLIIKWNKLNKNDIYNYTLRDIHGTENNFTGSVMGDEIIHNYSHLTPGTIHSFTLFTVVNGVRSKGYSFKSITRAACNVFVRRQE